MPDVRLEPAGEADYPAVVALTNRAYRGAGADASWNVESLIEGERINEDLLRADIAASPQAHLLLWKDDAGDLLGQVWLEPKGEGVWYLGLLAVRPGQQDAGLGRGLLTAAEDFARTRGGTRMRMSVVNLRHTLIAWYERRGYLHTGETEPFPYGDDRFGRPTRDDLEFVILAKRL